MSTTGRSARSAEWNLALAVLHLAQAVAVVVLATDFAITITQSLPTGPPGSAIASPEGLLDLPVGIAIATFLVLAGLDHLLTATVLRSTYERDLRRGSTASGGWSTRSARRSWSS